MSERKPGLFGLKKSNRDFTKKENWGKNQFNSSFPAALACYMESKGIEPVYLYLDKVQEGLMDSLKVQHGKINVRDLFGLPPHVSMEDVYFEFEGLFAPHTHFERDGSEPPRNDLVIRNEEGTEYYRGLEVKLTTIPDHTTHELDEEHYGCELVIRSVTIVHLAITIAEIYENNREELHNILNPITQNINNWLDEPILINLLPNMINAIDTILINNLDKQEPLILNPIWKTNGKSSALSDYCLDIFVWSNFALTRLFIDSIKVNRTFIDRYSRSLVWLIRLLDEFAKRGKMDYRKIYGMPFNSQTDKAFAVSGKKTHPYMACAELTKPRIRREEIGNIILNDGQLLLSPERRFDAAIVYSPDIFENQQER
jgi:hypothetical protein